MAEVYKNFADFRPVLSGYEPQGRVPRSTIISVMASAPGFENQSDSRDRLRRLERATESIDYIGSIDWAREPRYTIDPANLEKASLAIWRPLLIDKNPIDELSDMSDTGFWKSSPSDPNQLQFAWALNSHHIQILSSKSASEHPELSAVGSAAHWSAKNAGATWQQAVISERFAQERQIGIVGPHTQLLRLQRQMYGTKTE